MSQIKGLHKKLNISKQYFDSKKHPRLSKEQINLENFNKNNNKNSNNNKNNIREK